MGVRLVAALAWWDEPVEHLERLVASLAGHVDALVALDGRWYGMPGEGALSPLEQCGALNRGRDRGLDVRVISIGQECWASQVAKRDALMSAAAELGDWILVIDGDEFLQAGCDLRERLAAVDAVSADVTVVAMNRPWPYRDLAPLAGKSPRLFQAGVGVQGRHNGYHLDLRPVADLAGFDLADEVTIWHDNHSRPAARRAAAQAYRRVRQLEGLEAAA